MAITKMPIETFVREIGEAYDRRDGYIMGATGQNPRKWKVNSHWFTQYSNPRQHEKALYWRAHAARVWDCNGLAEGLYRDYTGRSIDTKARYNYLNWCAPKGRGVIPPEYRTAGAAVFWGSAPSNIHHVGYLFQPVNPNDPGGDWYLIEARGVMYGVVRTKLSQRCPDYWGWMTKYFQYPAIENNGHSEHRLGDRPLSNGMSGDDVRELQSDLIRLGYDLGRWGADGDFGDATEAALRQFQKNKGLKEDGIAGPATFDAIETALARLEKPVSNPRQVRITGGRCYVRESPDRTAPVLGVANEGDCFDYAGHTAENGWHEIRYRNGTGWVSDKYSRLK